MSRNDFLRAPYGQIHHNLVLKKSTTNKQLENNGLEVPFIPNFPEIGLKMCLFCCYISVTQTYFINFSQKSSYFNINLCILAFCYIHSVIRNQFGHKEIFRETFLTIPATIVHKQRKTAFLDNYSTKSIILIIFQCQKEFYGIKA